MSLLVFCSPGYFLSCFCAWECSFGSFVIESTEAAASEKGLDLETLNVMLLSWILMLSSTLLGVAVREVAWMSELGETSFVYLASCFFVGVMIYAWYLGNSVNDTKFTTEVPVGRE